MKKIAEGNKSALESVYKEFRGLVFAVALSVLKKREDAEDITADTFCTLFNSAKNYHGGSVKAYLATIARNLAINKINKYKREVFTDFTENESLYGEYSYSEDFSSNLALHTAINALNDDEREIVLMYNAGLKNKEIAQVLNIPIGTVSWKYNNALKKLKTSLTD